MTPLDYPEVYSSTTYEIEKIDFKSCRGRNAVIAIVLVVLVSGIYTCINGSITDNTIYTLI
jgi:hypothetical protein